MSSQQQKFFSNIHEYLGCTLELKTFLINILNFLNIPDLGFLEQSSSQLFAEEVSPDELVSQVFISMDVKSGMKSLTYFSCDMSQPSSSTWFSCETG